MKKEKEAKMKKMKKKKMKKGGMKASAASKMMSEMGMKY